MGLLNAGVGFGGDRRDPTSRGELPKEKGGHSSNYIIRNHPPAIEKTYPCENPMAIRNPILFATITFIVIIFYYFGNTPFSKAVFSMSPSSLVVHISTAQTALGPDDIAKFTVTISNPTTQPITVLIWGSPLDTKAAVLGIFKAVEVGDPEHKIIEGHRVMFRRVTPPPRADLVEILPGGDVTAEVALLGFSFEGDKSYQVRVEGRWMSAWSVEKDKVTADMLEEFGAKEEMTGIFRSNEITMSKA